MSTPEEKVSTVGIRNQVTLPKHIREKAKIGEKIAAYIQVREDMLVITLDPPDEGIVYNRIKISEKGQLVIPKNLRESKGIKEGSNLIFNSTNGDEITVRKLVEKRGSTAKNWRWNFLVAIIKSVGSVPNLARYEIVNNKLVLFLKKEIRNNDLTDLVDSLEKQVGTRLIIEKDDDKIFLIPMS
ncbi:MAG: AbrB/MazE/SpoVT family DNA-binding domain-containing protein [Candidatus Odinarchaeota archaeon]